MRLVSNSTADQSAIKSFAWATTSANLFQVAGPLFATSFATPGNHSVSLRVTSIDGLSAVASHTIVVAPSEPSLMQPFPIVLIVGKYGRYGLTISRLAVQAPAGAQITIKCNGRGCPRKSLNRSVASNQHGLATVVFRRIQHDRLPAGTRLIVRVFESGKVGKYTRFAIRSGKPPDRVDACVGPLGGKSIACPA